MVIACTSHEVFLYGVEHSETQPVPLLPIPQLPSLPSRPSLLSPPLLSFLSPLPPFLLLRLPPRLPLPFLLFHHYFLLPCAFLLPHCAHPRIRAFLLPPDDLGPVVFPGAREGFPGFAVIEDLQTYGGGPGESETGPAGRVEVRSGCCVAHSGIFK